MAKRKTQQVRGKKEAQLAIVEGSVVQQQSPQEQVYTPEDAEFDHYSKLLTGFFEKLTKWQNIAQTKGYEYQPEIRQFSVYRSDNGLFIVPGTSLSPAFVTIKLPNPQDGILEISTHDENPFSYPEDPTFRRGSRWNWKYL